MPYICRHCVVTYYMTSVSACMAFYQFPSFFASHTFVVPFRTGALLKVVFVLLPCSFRLCGRFFALLLFVGIFHISVSVNWLLSFLFCVVR